MPLAHIYLGVHCTPGAGHIESWNSQGCWTVNGEVIYIPCLSPSLVSGRDGVWPKSSSGALVLHPSAQLPLCSDHKWPLDVFLFLKMNCSPHLASSKSLNWAICCVYIVFILIYKSNFLILVQVYVCKPICIQMSLRRGRYSQRKWLFLWIQN